MAEQQVDESALKIDRWSKVFALVFAMAVFLVATVLTDNVTFNSTMAAVAGIGIRIYLPYQTTISSIGPDADPDLFYEDVPDYHYGALGAALMVGSFGAIAIMAVEPDYYTALIGGIAVAIAGYLFVQTLLPSPNE